MLLFWALVALLSAAAVALIMARATRAERRAGAVDPAVEVYRRQLQEIDEQAERGLLGVEEHRAAHAEAGRRLLREADAAAHASPPAPARGRRLVLAAALAAPILALAAYIALGAPGFPDQPYAARLKAWRKADPASLNLPQMAAVLEALAAEHPRDPQPLLYLARVEGGEGDLASAARTLRKALRLRPDSSEIWTAYGEALTAAGDGVVTASAAQAFERAAQLDPSAPEPPYFLGRAQIASGQVQAGLAAWRALEARLPPADPRRQGLGAEIAEVARTGALPAAAAPAQPPAEAGDQSAFIQAMVDRLAARLAANPDDPQGWARLIRAYGVLGQSDRRAAAMDRARRLFKDRPQDLRTALSGGS